MIVGQLGKLTGVPVDGDTFLGRAGVVRRADLAQIDTGDRWLFAAAVLAFLFLGQWRFPALPAPLLAVLLATVAVAVFDLERHGIAVVGAIPAGLPSPALPDLGDLRHLLLPAVGVLVVGYTDTVLTARAFATRGDDRSTRTRSCWPSARRTSAPACCAASRSAAAAAAPRSRSPRAAAPRCTRSSRWPACVGGPAVRRARCWPVSRPRRSAPIVVYAAVRLIDLPGSAGWPRSAAAELLLALAALAGVLVFDILYGVLLAVGLSVAEMLHRVARPHDAVQGFVPGLAGMHDIDDYPQATTVPGLLVYRYDSPLFFANAEDFRRRALAAVADQARTGRLVRAQRRGQRRGRHHRARRAGGAARGADRPRHRLRAGPGQAGPARSTLDAYGLTAAVGAGPHLPDPADRRRRVSRLGQATPRIMTLRQLGCIGRADDLTTPCRPRGRIVPYEAPTPTQVGRKARATGVMDTGPAEPT